jgi:hypothetical protein
MRVGDELRDVTSLKERETHVWLDSARHLAQHTVKFLVE